MRRLRFASVSLCLAGACAAAPEAPEAPLGARAFEPCPFEEPEALPDEPPPPAECAGAPALSWEARFRTPRADADAEWLAIVADGAFTAREERYQRTRCELERIRGIDPALGTDTSVDRVGAAGIRVAFDADADTAALRPFRCLDAALDATAEGSEPFSRDVRFDGLYNPAFTAPLYRDTPGVAAADADGVPGDHDEVRVVVDGDTARYAFLRRGGDDCQAGCAVVAISVLDAHLDGTIDYVARWRAGDPPNAVIEPFRDP